MPRRLVACGRTVALASAILVATLTVATAQPAAPNWELPTADGGSVNIAELLQEGPVVVSFWALWCNPCLKELPHLEQLAADHAGQLTVVSVNADNSKSVAKVAPYIASQGFESIVVALDTAGDVQREMQVGGVMPFLVVYNQGGGIAFRHTGYKEGDEVQLRTEVESMLAGRPLPPAAGGGARSAPSLDNVADWELSTADGNSLRFHDALRQGPVLVSFWALWCNPCLRELPHLNQLAGDYAGELTVLSVNIDNSKSVAKVQPYIESQGFTNVVVPLDTSGELQQLMQVGGVVPFLALYDEFGRIVYRHTGYKDGDEQELRTAVETMFAQRAAGAQPAGGFVSDLSQVVSATDQFEYSYSTETKTEIVENWLDVIFQFGAFRAGILLNNQAPSEEGDRGHELAHRYFEFKTGEFDVRVGQFYGLFGRGLVFNGYEDRTIRVDTYLDGIKASVRHGGLNATMMSGTPKVRDVDVRGANVDYAMAGGLSFGASGLTFLPFEDYSTEADPDVLREWVVAGRVSQSLPFASVFLEGGKKTGYDFNETTIDADEGRAIYGNANLFFGPLTFSIEASDYDKFVVVRRADGKQPLNRPPALTREHIYTLLNREPHNLNPDNEQGRQLEMNYAVGGGWSVLGNGSRIKNQSGELLFEEVYGHLEQQRLGPFRGRTGFSYQDGEKGIRQVVVLDLTIFFTERHSLVLEFEHAHVRLPSGADFSLGKYDEEFIKAEFNISPRWSFSAMLELNNKYPEQRIVGEDEGPFPAAHVAYNIAEGGTLNIWAGKRQAGNLCSGGVCKFEPAFEGVEFFGLFRF